MSWYIALGVGLLVGYFLGLLTPLLLMVGHERRKSHDPE